MDFDSWTEELEDNTRRMAEINRYYELKYNAYKNIGIEVLIVLIVIIIVNLGNFIPEEYTIFVNIILAIGIICRTALNLYDIFIRSNRNFEEYKFSDPNKDYDRRVYDNDPPTVKYDGNWLGIKGAISKSTSFDMA